MSDPDLLLTESSNAETEHIDRLSTHLIIEAILKADQDVTAALIPELPAIVESVDQIAERLQLGGRLFYIGAGTSGRLGVLDASECVPTFSVPSSLVVALIAGGDEALRTAVEGAEDDPEAAGKELALKQFRKEDVLVGIAASGRTPYVIGGLRYGRELGALTISVSCVAESAIGRIADIAISPLVGPEVISGSTRMKAGTATKLILNMLSTATMIKLGYVFGNRMVNVRPSNSKLRARAIAMIAEMTGSSAEEAELLLESVISDAPWGPVSMAVVMHRFGLTCEQADERLTRVNGNLRAALAVT
jgi:N-acetylmuramic acid 6-phosphate etherase